MQDWAIFQNRNAKNVTEIKGKTIKINNGKAEKHFTNDELLHMYMLIRQNPANMFMKENKKGVIDSKSGTLLKLDKVEHDGLFRNSTLKGRETEFSFKLTQQEAADIVLHVEKNKELSKVVSTLDELLEFSYNASNPIH